MSKQVKDLITKDFASRLDGVEDAVLVKVVGLNADKTFRLRRELRNKNIELMVIRNGLARRATEGTSLSPALNKMDGALAFAWGAEDFVSLAKEITISVPNAVQVLRTRRGDCNEHRDLVISEMKRLGEQGPNAALASQVWLSERTMYCLAAEGTR